MPDTMQTGRIRPFVSDAILPLWQSVSLDDSGSAHTAWSPLADLQARQNQLRAFVLFDIQLTPHIPLLGYGIVLPGTIFEIARALHVECLGLSRRDTHIRETIRYGQQLAVAPHLTEGPNGIGIMERLRLSHHTNFWWDTAAQCMLSFDAPFMQRLPQILESSWS